MPIKQAYITVVGSSNTDLVIRCKHLPEPGETVLGGAFEQFSGGKGANQAVAAARAVHGELDIKVAFVGMCGDDDFGRQARLNLHNEGVNIRYFYRHPTSPSGVALIFVGGEKRENMIAVAKSANDALSTKEIESSKVLLRRSKIVLCQLEIPLEAVIFTAKMTAEYSGKFILNPAPARYLPQKLFPLIDVITPNHNESLLLTGEADVRGAAQKLYAWGCRHVAITLGGKGVLLYDKQGFREIAASRVKPQDTVGAGDCFSGWLAAGLGEGKSFDAAAAIAVNAATISVMRDGAQNSMPLREEVLKAE